MEQKTKIVIFAILMLMPFMSLANNKTLEKARMLYYEAVEDEDKIEKSIELFEDIMNMNAKYKGVAKTYLGSLTAMKAAHAFWPIKKLNLANDGIDMMEEGVALDPDNIESLFIEGTTLFYLPFFFGKADEAEENFNRIISLLDENAVNKYDHKMLVNVLDFIMENAELTNKQMKKAKYLKNQFAGKK